MKKSVFIATVLGLSLMACKKENKTNVDIESSKLNSLKMDESKSFPFMATDGSRVIISFKDEGNDNTMTIKSENNMSYVLDKKDADSFTMVFERNGVSAKLTKDSLNIIQGDNVIPLVRIN